MNQTARALIWGAGTSMAASVLVVLNLLAALKTRSTDVLLLVGRSRRLGMMAVRRARVRLPTS